MTRVIFTTAVCVHVGDRVEVYEGPVGQGQWRSGVVTAKATQAGPEGGVTAFWLDGADTTTILAAVTVRSGRDVRIVETAEARQLAVVTDERDEALAQVEWLVGCPDGCDCEAERAIEDVKVTAGVL